MKKKEDKKEIEADIYVINSDGGNLTNLETNKELVLPCNNLYSFDERMKSLKRSKWVIKKPQEALSGTRFLVRHSGAEQPRFGT